MLTPDDEAVTKSDHTASLRDWRRRDGVDALKLRAALGTSLLTATGTTIAAALALVAVAASLHEIHALAVVLWACGGAVLFTSAYVGGLAIRRVTARGSHGDWRLSTSAYHFSAQAGAFVLGTVIFAAGSVVAFSGRARPSRDGEAVRTVSRLAAELQHERDLTRRLDERILRLERPQLRR